MAENNQGVFTLGTLYAVLKSTAEEYPTTHIRVSDGDFRYKITGVYVTTAGVQLDVRPA